MDCKIDGCTRDVMYTGKMLCQVHYFRFMRYGTYDLVGPRDRNGNSVTRKMRRSNQVGYQLLFAPSHPLVMADGYVYEHRMVVYSKYNNDLPDCEICGKPTNWDTCHIDHKDNDITNNYIGNLRPLCRGCNTFRDYPEMHTKNNCMAVTFAGEIKTPEEWSRDDRVDVTGATIARRKRQGMSDYDALFSKKLTHNGNAVAAKARKLKKERESCM